MTAGLPAALRDRSRRRAHGLLLGGATAGIALAAAGLLRPSSRAPAGPQPPGAPTGLSALAPDVVARVNDRPIRRRDFEDVLAQEKAAGAALDGPARRRILDGMIDEELRVQRALSLDLHLTDARVRRDLASAVAEATIAAAIDGVPDLESLRRHYEERREHFARLGPIRVRQVWVAIHAGNLGEAFVRARDGATLLRKDGDAFDTAVELIGSPDPRPIPDRFLEPEALEEYVGRAALDVALLLRPGEVSDPVRANDGFRVLQLVGRRPSKARSFEESRRQVEADYQRARAEHALAAAAKALRSDARIIAAEAP